MLCKENNWTEVNRGEDLVWAGLSLSDEEIISHGTDVSVARIPSMRYITNKKTMGFILNKFREFYPENYWFYPKTYLLPEDTERIQKKIDKGGVFIAKPAGGSLGEGLTLIEKLTDIPKFGKDEWIVQ